MAIEKEVRVTGKSDVVWGKILTTLSMHGYTIKSQVQNVQLTAEKGSRLVSTMVGGTKGGYRTAEIAMSPVDSKMLVKFKFTFSALGAGTAWGGAKDEIEKMIGDFEHECSKDQDKACAPSPTAQEPSKPCPKCHKQVTSNFVLCPFCGEPLKSVCPKCFKEVSAEFAMCPFCGQPLKQSNMCKKCEKELKPEFAMCPFCGTPR